jgi:hypothetical protein
MTPTRRRFGREVTDLLTSSFIVPPREYCVLFAVPLQPDADYTFGLMSLLCCTGYLCVRQAAYGRPYSTKVNIKLAKHKPTIRLAWRASPETHIGQHSKQLLCPGLGVSAHEALA